MLPSGGSITVVLPLRMWSPLNSRPSLAQQQAQVVGGMARGVDHFEGVGDVAFQLPAAQGEPFAVGQCTVGREPAGRAPWGRKACPARAGAGGRPRPRVLPAGRRPVRGRHGSACTRWRGYRHPPHARGARDAPRRPGRGRWRCSRWTGRPPGSCWCPGRSWRRGWPRSAAAGCAAAARAARAASRADARSARRGRPGPVHRRGASCSM